MASIWKGSLTFGLVSVPVELKTAVREDHISFRMLHEKDLSPIKYERVCAAEGEAIPWNEIVKGYEYEKGKFIVVTDEDFKSAAIESSNTIDVMDFVKEAEIDPRYFDTPYYLVPGKGGDKAYALLREAIRKTGSVGIGKIIMRQKQHIAGVRVVGDAMVLELMRFQNELVDLDEYKFPSAENVRPQELQMAEQLIGNLAETFHPEKYTDEYRENLMKVIRAKMKGKKIKLEEPEKIPAEGKVLDLMERLRQSLDQGKKAGSVRAERKSAGSSQKSARKKSSKRSA
ncbi:MAG: Ku protein [Gemmatimonadota bacterium]|nr:Ku protein [Gemmatimonadota bacterium]